MILQCAVRTAAGQVATFHISKLVLEEGIEGGLDDRLAIETARGLAIDQIKEETGAAPAMVLVGIQGGKK